MSKNGTDKNEGSILHPGAHVPGSLAKKSVYVPLDAYGQTYYAGQTNPSPGKDPFRSYFGFLWSEDKIKSGSRRPPSLPRYRDRGDPVIDRHPGHQFQGIPAPMSPGGGILASDVWWEPGWDGIQVRPLDGDGYKVDKLRIYLPRTSMTLADWIDHFKELIQNEHLHPGKAQAFFRSNTLGVWHRTYVISGKIATNWLDASQPHNGQWTVESYTGEVITGTDPTDEQVHATPYGHKNAQWEMIELYEQHYGPIIPIMYEHLAEPGGSGADNVSGPHAGQYYDYFFEMPIPFHNEELENLNDTPSVLYFDVSPRYHFYEAGYENKISNITVPAGSDSIKLPCHYLPNIYLMLHSEYGPPDPGLKAMVSLNGALSKDFTTFLNYKGEKKRQQIRNDYFKKWASEFEAATNNLSSDYAKNKNIMFTMEDVSYLKDFNKHINKFPFYNEIVLKTQTSGMLCDTLQKTKIDHALLSTFHAINENPNLNATFLSKEPMMKGYETFQLDAESNHIDNSMAVTSRTIKSIDLMLWLESYSMESSTDDVLDSLGTIGATSRTVGKNSSEIEYFTGAPKFLQKLVSTIAISKLNQVAAKEMRRYSDIISGKPAYAEVVAYRVAKHRVENGQINPVPEQNFYFSNSSDLGDLTYYDTQVKFGDQFKYLVYAYTIVIGSKTTYAITNPNAHTNVPDERDHTNYPWHRRLNTAMATAHCSAAFKMMEVPYYGFEPGEKSSGFVYDDPPIPPNVDIGGYRGVTDKIQIMISNNYGEFIEKSHAIDSEDIVLFENAKIYQSLSKKQVANGSVRFRTDDTNNKFEIFRIGPDIVTGQTPIPVGFSDFQRRKIKVIGSNITDSAAFVDTLQPNKKYYYVFRSVDVHNNVSNPSQVYEVELINNPSSKLSYVHVAPYDFKEILQPKNRKSLRRYLHIEPRHEQKVIDFSFDDPEVNIDEVIESPPLLGIVKDPLFVERGDETKSRFRKFKVRLTSKRSGKKIDVNVKFIREYNKYKKPQVF